MGLADTSRTDQKQTSPVEWVLGSPGLCPNLCRRQGIAVVGTIVRKIALLVACRNPRVLKQSICSHPDKAVAASHSRAAGRQWFPAGAAALQTRFRGFIRTGYYVFLSNRPSRSPIV